jgi:hypothetical protein
MIEVILIVLAVAVGITVVMRMDVAPPAPPTTPDSALPAPEPAGGAPAAD